MRDHITFYPSLVGVLSEACEAQKSPHRVAGKLVRKCPLMARWLVTRDMWGACLHQTVHNYAIEKTEL
jgi:hypothetical protein